MPKLEPDTACVPAAHGLHGVLSRCRRRADAPQVRCTHTVRPVKNHLLGGVDRLIATNTVRPGGACCRCWHRPRPSGRCSTWPARRCCRACIGAVKAAESAERGVAVGLVAVERPVVGGVHALGAEDARLSAWARVPAMCWQPPLLYSLMLSFMPGFAASILACSRGSSLIGLAQHVADPRRSPSSWRSQRLRGLCAMACTCASVSEAPFRLVTRLPDGSFASDVPVEVVHVDQRLAVGGARRLERGHVLVGEPVGARGRSAQLALPRVHAAEAVVGGADDGHAGELVLQRRVSERVLVM
jgi:hypothetical protein